MLLAAYLETLKHHDNWREGAVTHTEALKLLLDGAGSGLQPTVTCQWLQPLQTGWPCGGLFIESQSWGADPFAGSKDAPIRGAIVLAPLTSPLTGILQHDLVRQTLQLHRKLLVTNHFEFAQLEWGPGGLIPRETYRLGKTESFFRAATENPLALESAHGLPLVEFLERAMLFDAPALVNKARVRAKPTPIWRSPQAIPPPVPDNSTDTSRLLLNPVKAEPAAPKGFGRKAAASPNRVASWPTVSSLFPQSQLWPPGEGEPHMAQGAGSLVPVTVLMNLGTEVDPVLASDELRARVIPLYLPARDAGFHLFSNEDEAPETPNLSSWALAYLIARAATPHQLMFHALAMSWGQSSGPAADETTDASDPVIPLPAQGPLLHASADLGERARKILEGKQRPDESGPRNLLAPIGRLVKRGNGIVNPYGGDLELSHDWGVRRQDDKVLRGPGCVESRPWTSGEWTALAPLWQAEGLDEATALTCLGPTAVDVFLNRHVRWSAVPAPIWDLTLAGIPCLQQWLALRSHAVLQRDVTAQEAREFTLLVRALCRFAFLGPALRSNRALCEEKALRVAGAQWDSGGPRC